MMLICGLQGDKDFAQDDGAVGASAAKSPLAFLETSGDEVLLLLPVLWLFWEHRHRGLSTYHTACDVIFLLTREGDVVGCVLCV